MLELPYVKDKFEHFLAMSAEKCVKQTVFERLHLDNLFREKRNAFNAHVMNLQLQTKDLNGFVDAAVRHPKVLEEIFGIQPTSDAKSENSSQVSTTG